jgi:hypothetical protein
MKSPFVIFAAVFLIGWTVPAGAQTFNWHNAVFDTVVDSDGDALDGTFVFELGAFADGFVPIPENVDEWSSNWLVFDRADYNPTLGYFAGAVEMLSDGTSSSAEMTPGAPSFEGELAYIWIRNNDAAAPGSEWLLLSDENWVFPMALNECCGNGLPIEWATSDLDSGDVPLYGGQGGVEGPGVFTPVPGAVLQTATFIVPEPSVAACLVLASCGLLRRRRA